jgi:hypothetical protein
MTDVDARGFKKTGLEMLNPEIPNFQERYVQTYSGHAAGDSCNIQSEKRTVRTNRPKGHWEVYSRKLQC